MHGTRTDNPACFIQRYFQLFSYQANKLISFNCVFSKSSDMKFYFLDFEAAEGSISKLSLAVMRYSTILLLFTTALWS